MKKLIEELSYNEKTWRSKLIAYVERGSVCYTPCPYDLAHKKGLFPSMVGSQGCKECPYFHRYATTNTVYCLYEYCEQITTD